MNNFKKLVFKAFAFSALGVTALSSIGLNNANVNATSFDNDDYYKLLASAIDASDTNAFEKNKNPQIFDSFNETFRNAISARKDVDTNAWDIESTSAYEFSKKYAQTFSTEMSANVKIYDVTTDVSGKFKRDVNTESWKQKIESYEYYYWLAKKYTVNVDWKEQNINDALSKSFKRELDKVNSVISAKELLREYGTHVYKKYVLGGKLEITKYFAQDASYELSETEKEAATSLNVIVDTAKVDAKVSGSVNFSRYESNSASSSRYYSQMGYDSAGGETTTAVNASDLFQYKTQFGTGTASGFLYEAWTNSFNKDDVSLKVVKAENPVAIWDILDANQYSSQINYLKKAWDNMCYESYAEKCGYFGIPCEYIDSLEYNSKGINANFTPYSSNINLPTESEVKINLSDLITKSFDSSQYTLSLSSNSATVLDGNALKIKKGTIGMSFDIELQIEGIKVYSLRVTIKEGSFGGGYGTQQQPYLIKDKSHLFELLQEKRYLNNAFYYQLSNDIDLAGEKTDTGGSGTSSSFRGTFDGNGHSIKNFTIKTSDFRDGYPYMGLFGKNEGTIKNLVVDNAICLNNGLASIQNSNISLSVGIVTGYNAGVINNCLVKNSAIRISACIEKDSCALNVGGIAGYSEGIINYSAFVDGNIYGIATKGNGTINVGGISGKIAGSKIAKAYVNNSNFKIANPENVKFAMGGIVGSMETRTAEDTSLISPKLSTCLVYSISKNKSGSSFGYIAGTESHGEFDNCYFASMKDTSVSGGSKNGCIRRDSLTLSSLSSSFDDEWIDGGSGPVLKIHGN